MRTRSGGAGGDGHARAVGRPLRLQPRAAAALAAPLPRAPPRAAQHMDVH